MNFLSQRVRHISTPTLELVIQHLVCHPSKLTDIIISLATVDHPPAILALIKHSNSMKLFITTMKLAWC